MIRDVSRDRERLAPRILDRIHRLGDGVGLESAHADRGPGDCQDLGAGAPDPLRPARYEGDLAGPVTHATRPGAR